MSGFGYVKAHNGFRMLFRRKHNTEVERAHAALTMVVAAFASRIEENTLQTTYLRSEVDGMRRELAALPNGFDRSAIRSAMEFVGEAHRQLGAAQAQAALLADSDAMLALAGELAASGALDALSDRDGEDV